MNRREFLQRLGHTLPLVAGVRSESNTDRQVALGVSVADYGAVGDGVTDDTAAVQAALTQAGSIGTQLLLEQGVYCVEGLTASNFSQITILGRGAKLSILKLRDDDGRGGIGQILSLTDVVEFTLRDVGVYGNFEKAKAGARVRSLIYYSTSVATNGRKDFVVHLENVEFTQSAKGYGHFTVELYENASDTFSEFALVSIRNVLCSQHGTFGSAIRVRGPGTLVDIENLYSVNDGPYGLECYGPTTYPGSEGQPLNISADKDYFHYIRQARVSNYSAYRDNGALFTQRVKLLDASDITIVEDCTNPYYDVPPVVFKANAATDVIHATVPDGGYGNHSIVRVTSTGALPAPLVNGNLYYVRDQTGSTFKLALTNDGTPIDLADAGTGIHSIEFLGYTYTTAIKGDDNIHTPEDPARHHYRNCIMVKSSPHTGNRNFSWEESFVGTVGQVLLEDSYFNRGVNLMPAYPGLMPSIVRCTFVPGWLPGASYGTTSPLAIGAGLVDDCVFASAVTFTQVGDLTIRNSRFSGGLQHFMAAGISATLRLLENVWNIADANTARLEFTPPDTGSKLLIELRGNRIPQSAAHATLVRVKNMGDLAGLTINANGNDLGTDIAVGIANDPTLQWQSADNRNSSRASADYPLLTLANTAAPSVIGGGVFVTGGATPITDFADGVDYNVITVYIAAGHQVKNSTTIVTRNGDNIVGPNVRKFSRFGGVWYEI